MSLVRLVEISNPRELVQDLKQVKLKNKSRNFLNELKELNLRNAGNCEMPKDQNGLISLLENSSTRIIARRITLEENPIMSRVNTFLNNNRQQILMNDQLMAVYKIEPEHKTDILDRIEKVNLFDDDIAYVDVYEMNCANTSHSSIDSNHPDHSNNTYPEDESSITDSCDKDLSNSWDDGHNSESSLDEDPIINRKINDLLLSLRQKKQNQNKQSTKFGTLTNSNFNQLLDNMEF